MILGIMLLAHLITTRIVAETGLCFVRSVVETSQIYTNLPATAFSPRDIFFSGALDDRRDHHPRKPDVL